MPSFYHSTLFLTLSCLIFRFWLKFLVFHHLLCFIQLLLIHVVAHLLRHFGQHFRIVLHGFQLSLQIEYTNKETANQTNNQCENGN